MYDITVYKHDNSANIEPLSLKRDWMDNTIDRHAYNCFPVSLSNQMGWGISFPEDITFIWDGISDTSPKHVKVIKGSKYCSTGRANGTISFNTGLVFRTSEDVSMIHMPVPNMFIDGVQAFTTVISTSFFSGEFPCAMKITKHNVPITIPANQPVISVMPMTLGNLNNTSIKTMPVSEMKMADYSGEEYGMEVDRINQSGKWTHFYRNATDHRGNSIGKHELKALRLKVE